jgi:hypothetical protein
MSVVSTYTYPKYVRLGNTALCHQGKGLYYRDAGNWETPTLVKEGKLVADFPGMAFDGEELKKITQKEWAKDNEGYI